MVINLLGDKDGSKGTIPPSHLFKIRQLLAMGKVIVSEVCLNALFAIIIE